MAISCETNKQKNRPHGLTTLQSFDPVQHHSINIAEWPAHASSVLRSDDPVMSRTDEGCSYTADVLMRTAENKQVNQEMST